MIAAPRAAGFVKAHPAVALVTESAGADEQCVAVHPQHLEHSLVTLAGQPFRVAADLDRPVEARDEVDPQPRVGAVGGIRVHDCRVVKLRCVGGSGPDLPHAVHPTTEPLGRQRMRTSPAHLPVAGRVSVAVRWRGPWRVRSVGRGPVALTHWAGRSPTGSRSVRLLAGWAGRRWSGLRLTVLAVAPRPTWAFVVAVGPAGSADHGFSVRSRRPPVNPIAGRTVTTGPLHGDHGAWPLGWAGLAERTLAGAKVTV